VWVNLDTPTLALVVFQVAAETVDFDRGNHSTVKLEILDLSP
jgi:hypothetical protein